MTRQQSRPNITVSLDQPFPIEAMVYEEDTYRVLSPDNHIREIRQPLLELQSQVVGQQADKLGDLVIRGSRWFAILHDFDQSESYASAVLPLVYSRISDAIMEREISSIGLQPLGAHHGPDDVGTAIDQIGRIVWPSCLQSIWIVARRQ